MRVDTGATHEITIRIPEGLKLRDIIALEEAMMRGVSHMVAFLIERGICERNDLEELDWQDFEEFKAKLRSAIQEASRVPKATTQR